MTILWLFLDMTLGKLLTIFVPVSFENGHNNPSVESEINIYSPKSVPFFPGKTAR